MAAEGRGGWDVLGAPSAGGDRQAALAAGHGSPLGSPRIEATPRGWGDGSALSGEATQHGFSLSSSAISVATNSSANSEWVQPSLPGGDLEPGSSGVGGTSNSDSNQQPSSSAGARRPSGSRPPPKMFDDAFR